MRLHSTIFSHLRRTPLHPQWLLNDRKLLSKWIKSNAHGVVLDIGCADRWIEHHLPENAEYIGLDYLETGDKLYQAKPDLFADAACLPFADASCDTIILLEVLEHIRNPDAALSEISRVLRPGGCLLLSMPFLYPIHDAPHDYQRLTRHGLERNLSEAGFDKLLIEERLSSMETAALLLCLALGASIIQSIKQLRIALILTPVIIALILIINVFGWVLARIFPNWKAMTYGFRSSARKSTPLLQPDAHL